MTFSPEKKPKYKQETNVSFRSHCSIIASGVMLLSAMWQTLTVDFNRKLDFKGHTQRDWWSFLKSLCLPWMKYAFKILLRSSLILIQNWHFCHWLSKMTVNCDKNTKKKSPIKDRTTNHCGLSFYKELHPYSLCCSHQYAATAVNSNTAEVFPQYVLNTFITVPQTHLPICCPVTNVIPPVSTHLATRSRAVLPRCCVLRNLGRSSSREGGHQWTHHTYQRLQCSAEKAPRLTWKNKRAGPAVQRACAGMQSLSYLVWSSLYAAASAYSSRVVLPRARKIYGDVTLLHCK